ncbi:MAG: RHS repeat protein [Nanoarchaeota archaeon]|nr:RHS repeat protein [Nanoarchaeota archaeon]
MKTKYLIIGSMVVFLLVAMPLIQAYRPDGPNPRGGGGGVEYPLAELYPEDYTFRSGLAYNIKYYDQNGKLIQEEINKWNTRYPFNDPSKISNYDIRDHVEDNVGFKAQIIRYPNPDLSPVESGRVSYTLALIPFLEAKETIIYDKDSTATYKVYAEQTEFDIYGNPKVVHNLGHTGKGKGATFTAPVYKTYNIKNPYYSDGCCALRDISAEYTNFQLEEARTYTESVKRDTLISETDYVYEEYPIDSGSYPIIYEMNYDRAKRLYSFYGWTNIPTRTVVTDAFGRIISETEVEYETGKSNFETCNVGNENKGCIKSACGVSNPASLNPFESVFDDCLDIDSAAADSCIRQSPTKISSYGSSGSGYIATAPGDKEHVVASVINSKLDNCGNVVEMNVEASYEHPTAGFSTYSKTVKTEFSSGKVKPTSITIVSSSGLPDITKRATYYRENLIKTVTDERGTTTNYEYDDLGRVTKLWIYPDSSSSPTATYQYNPFWDNSRVEIYEKRKIDTGKYTETYYYYDGMGRFIQSKTYDAGTDDTGDDSIIMAGSAYDVSGRVLREYRPIRRGIDTLQTDYENWWDFDFGFYNNGQVYDKDSNIIISKYIEYEYDSIGRVLTTTDTADGSVVRNDYSLEGGGAYDKLATTDQEGKTRTFYSDARGNLIKVALPSP